MASSFASFFSVLLSRPIVLPTILQYLCLYICLIFVLVAEPVFTGLCHQWSIVWLIDWLIDWLIGWLTDWLIDWLIDWLVDWLIGWLIAWLIEWLIDWLSHIDQKRKTWQKCEKVNPFWTRWFGWTMHTMNQMFSWIRAAGRDLVKIYLKKRIKQVAVASWIVKKIVNMFFNYTCIHNLILMKYWSKASNLTKT